MALSLSASTIAIQDKTSVLNTVSFSSICNAMKMNREHPKMLIATVTGLNPKMFDSSSGFKLVRTMSTSVVRSKQKETNRSNS